MGRRAWWATVYRFAETKIQLSTHIFLTIQAALPSLQEPHLSVSEYDRNGIEEVTVL